MLYFAIIFAYLSPKKGSHSRMNPLVRHTHYGFIQQTEYIMPLQRQQQPMYVVDQYYRPIFQPQIQQHPIKLPSSVNDTDANNEQVQSDRKLALKRYNHNKDFLKYANIGDIVQYHSDQDHLQYERDLSFSIYVGNQNFIMYKASTIVTETFQNLAKEVFLSINKDFERNFYQLPDMLTINRALYALKHRHTIASQFSTDKNFVMWCKFDINKSDIDFSTNNNRLTSVEIKYMTIHKFLNSIDTSKLCETCDESTPSLASGNATVTVSLSGSPPVS
jgi:hypothetical protein